MAEKETPPLGETLSEVAVPLTAEDIDMVLRVLDASSFKGIGFVATLAALVDKLQAARALMPPVDPR